MSPINTFIGANQPERPGRSTGGAYTVDSQDTVQPLADFPQSSIGAPLPFILASEQALIVAFYLEEPDPNWDGTSCEIVTADMSDEPLAVVRFSYPVTHYFGPPNDEALSGHPLAERGLRPYGAFEVLSSSWMRALRQMNSVHPCHRPDAWSAYRHFILTFHDSLFECIARSYTIERTSGSLRSVAASLVAVL